MKTKDYSANYMSFRFWFTEFSTLLNLLNEGLTIEEIKKINNEENLVNARSSRRSKEIMNALIHRIDNLDPSFIQLFFSSNLETKKYLCLLTCLKEDRLLFEYTFELVRGKILDGFEYFSRADQNRFFDNKIYQSEKVASWSQSTLNKINSAYVMLLTEASILKKEKNNYLINTLLISEEAQKWTKENGFGIIYEALTGEQL